MPVFDAQVTTLNSVANATKSTEIKWRSFRKFWSICDDDHNCSQ